jgi:hypothetical protein
MGSYVTIKLDTQGPASPSVVIDSAQTYATDTLLDLAISCADTDKTGFTMKIWGDLDLAQAKTDGLVGGAATGTTEADAQWISYSATKQVKAAAGDGVKTIYLKIRDAVYNVSAQASDTITIDMTKPTVVVSGPDQGTISKQAGKDTSILTFTVTTTDGETTFLEYKVKVVPSGTSDHTAGVQIGTANGSSNVSGVAGNYANATPISVTIKGADLEAASADDGDKIVKVFVKDRAGNWSA